MCPPPRAYRPACSSARCRLRSGRSGPQLRGAVFGGPRYCPYWNASFIDGSSGNSNEVQPRYKAATPAIFRCLWLRGDRPCACRCCPPCGPREDAPRWWTRCRRPIEYCQAVGDLNARTRAVRFLVSSRAARRYRLVSNRILNRLAYATDAFL
jgi:hypothetical protein